jgi:hypothetical protein
MFVSKLPPKPDFDVVAAAAPASADRHTLVLPRLEAHVCGSAQQQSGPADTA